MAILIQPKQITKLLRANLYTAGYLFPAAATSVVTTALTTAAATAGDGLVPVPVQTASTGLEGFVVTSGENTVSIFGTAQQKLIDSAGTELYGRLTQSAGVYTLSVYSLVLGVETAYTFATATTIDFVVSYQYTFEHLPSDSLVGGSVRHIGDDPSNLGGRIKYELLTVTAINTLTAISTNYVTGAFATLTVNGQVVDRFGGALAAFSISGTTVTWSAVNAGFSLITTDRVVCSYTF